MPILRRTYVPQNRLTFHKIGTKMRAPKMNSPFGPNSKEYKAYLKNLREFAKEQRKHNRKTYSKKRKKPKKKKDDTEWTKPKTMWAYVSILDKTIHCDTSQKRLRGFFAEQGKSKRIRKVKIYFEKEKTRK